MARFSDETLRRYSRQILLREVGGRGQQALLDSRVDMLVLPMGGGIAAVAAQYLLRAGAAHVRWFAKTAAAAQVLRPLQAIEQEPLAPEQQGRIAGPFPDEPSGPRMMAARLSECPPALYCAPPDAICIAAWQAGTKDASLYWATARGCGRRALADAATAARAAVAPLSAGSADPVGQGDSLNADALVFGSALALGMIQGLLLQGRAEGTYFDPGAAYLPIREAPARPHAADGTK